MRNPDKNGQKIWGAHEIFWGANRPALCITNWVPWTKGEQIICTKRTKRTEYLGAIRYKVEKV
jgi:hypothetical protein